MCMELKVKKSGRGLFVYLPKGAGYIDGDTIKIPKKEGGYVQTHKNHLTEERVREIVEEEIDKRSGL